MTWSEQPSEPGRQAPVAMCVLRIEGRGVGVVRITVRTTPDIANSELETMQSFADSDAALSAVGEFLRGYQANVLTENNLPERRIC